MTETVSFPAVDGSKLVATLTMPKTGKAVRAVILTHGWRSARAGTRNLGVSERLERDNIASLALDFRGHGDSEGDIRLVTVQREAEDILSALDYLATVPGVDLTKGVGIAGASIGGSAALYAMAQSPERFRTAVFIAPRLDFSEVHDDMYSFGEAPNRVENKDMLPAGKQIDFYALGEKLKGKRILIIHGSRDEFIPISQIRPFVAIDQKNFDLLEIIGGDHRMVAHTKMIVADTADHLADNLRL